MGTKNMQFNTCKNKTNFMLENISDIHNWLIQNNTQTKGVIISHKTIFIWWNIPIIVKHINVNF